MSETPEAGAEQARAAVQRDNSPARAGRLSQALAWVGIIAGVVFVVAVIFFSGFFLGWSSTGHGIRPTGQMGSDGSSSCPMMGSGGMMGPGNQGPGRQGPDHQGPGKTESPTPAPPTPPPGPHRRG